MIVAVVGTLEGFRAKLQQTIDHVKSGVNHLNEDQIEAAQEMLLSLHTQFDDVVDSCLSHLRVRTVSVELVPPPPAPEPAVDPPAEPAHPAADPSDGHQVIHLPKTWKQHDDAGREVTVHVENGKSIGQIDEADGKPTAQDLDATAAEDAAKEATAAPKPLWGIGSIFSK